MRWWKRSPIRRDSRQVWELAEDIRVAILEFQDRYPHTSPAEIRRAMRLVKRKRLDLDETVAARSTGDEKCREARKPAS